MKNYIISNICKHVIEESLKCIINESEDIKLNDNIKVIDKDVSDEIKFFIPDNGLYGDNSVSGDALVSHYLQKLKTLRNKAISAGVNLTFDCFKETIDGEDGYTIIIKSNFPEIKVDGYKFIGCVYPIKGLTYGLICPSPEFKDNMDVCNKMKNVAVRGTCDGCHRTTDRSCYYMFLDKKTNEIKKFGGTCAQKYFGINISKKVSILFDALYNAFTADPFYNFETDQRMTNARFNSISTTEMNIMEYSSCAFIALYGPYSRIKGNGDFDRIREYYNKLASAKNEFDVTMTKNSKRYSDIVNASDKIRELYIDFSKNCFEWAESLTPNSSFEISLQQHALVLSGAKVPKKVMGKIKVGIIPYVYLSYFQSKEKEQNKRPILEPFNGVKTFGVKIKEIKEIPSKFSDSLYYFYLGETNNNELVCWAFNKKDDNIKVNDYVQVNGEYLRRSKDDMYAILTKVTLGENKQAEEERKISYPEDGYKYVKDEAKFLKVTEDYFLVEMSDGCKYFISNKKTVIDYRGYDLTEIKFKNWEEFSVGQTITINGKVKSYMKNNGGKGYKLVYVKLL